LGTTFVLAERISLAAVLLAIGTGLLACAILVVNNLRDVDTDGRTGKRTLAVMLGAENTRTVFAVMVIGALMAATAAAFFEPGSLLALAALIPAIKPVGIVLKGAHGPALIPALGATGMTEFVYGALLLVGLLSWR
jgi:1,4-dihydroxy-2-naphthoate octaprenyltransferase